jgi:F-type H+-transporting ATPase subunit gamma
VRTYGKKARDFMTARGVAVAEARVDVTNAKYTAEATALANELTEQFSTGGADEVWVAFNQFKSTLAQIPTFTKILPLAIEAGGAEAGPDYRYEPAGTEILDALLPLYLRTQLLQAFLETEAGEHAARMTAMDNATRNASDLIKALTLQYNRGRQAAITKELIEIVSGAEAL